MVRDIFYHDSYEWQEDFKNRYTNVIRLGDFSDDIGRDHASKIFCDFCSVYRTVYGKDLCLNLLDENGVEYDIVVALENYGDLDGNKIVLGGYGIYLCLDTHGATLIKIAL